MILVDLFCGGGGAAVGFRHAAKRLGIELEIIGVDIVDQPSYPFDFVKADALDFLLSLIRGDVVFGRRWRRLGDVHRVHASPPCQGYGAATKYLVTRNAPKLIEPIRELLLEAGIERWTIENVVGAPLRNPVQICGSMFPLDVKRHRLFECHGFNPLRGFEVLGIDPRCAHGRWTNRYPTHARKDKAQTSPVVHVYGTGGGAGKDLDLWRRVMETPWMQTKAEVAEAIPPRYTELIGLGLLG